VQARHGHKSRARTFDGYKSHLSVDPDEELITNVAVTAANTAIASHRRSAEEPTTGAPADAESVAVSIAPTTRHADNADNARIDG